MQNLRLSITRMEEDGHKMIDIEVVQSEGNYRRAPEVPVVIREGDAFYADIALSPVEEEAVATFMHLYGVSEGFGSLVDSLIVAAREIEKSEGISAVTA